MHIKAEGMIKFDILHILAEIAVNPVIHQKNAHVRAAYKTCFTQLEIILNPSF